MNLAETRRFKANAFLLTYGVMKNRTHYFPLCPRICLDIKSADFNLGKLLNTTNAVRFSMTMFSWQPLLRIPICRFLYSTRLTSKLNGKKYSHITLRNRSPITEGESDHVSRRRMVIITLPISVSMAFLNVQQTFRAGQPGMSSIKIT